MVNFKGKLIDSFGAISDEYESSIYAKKIAIRYLGQILPLKEQKGSITIKICYSKELNDDAFTLGENDYLITISGGKRGVIYGTYELLQRYFQFEFYGHNIELTPAQSINIDKICYESKPSFKYREILGVDSSYNIDTVLQLRLNSNFWFNLLKKEHGDGYKMAGIPAHSLTGEFLLKPFIKTNPEYFALVDGKRITTKDGQMCFTNKDAILMASKEVIKVIEKCPDANYVSITTGDNSNYCRCPSCLKAYEKESPSVLFYKALNEMAKIIKKKYPNILIQTFSYMDLNELPKGFAFEDNIIIQYCNGNCANHSYDDKECRYNQSNLKVFKSYSRVFKNILMWDYPNCFKYEMVLLPDLYFWKKKFQYYVKHNVYGVFLEYNHRDGDGTCVFNELKTYLLSKLLWNPFISDAEFEQLMEKFCRAYYKESWKEIIEYLHLYESAVDRNKHFNYDLMNLETKAPNFDLIDSAKKDEFFSKADRIWEEAFNKASNKKIIEKEYLGYLYLKMLTLFEPGDQNPQLIEQNQRLIEGIKKYKIKLTFWGQSIEDQLKDIDKYQKLSPREWNYKW